MKTSEVTVPWNEGLHLRPSAQLVRIGQQAQSTVLLKSGQKIANIRSILAILTLAATMGTTLTVEASGADELEVTQAIERMFAQKDLD